jgi:hypothetical protein
MAVATQILEQGPSNIVMHFTNSGDAEAAVLKVDVSALTPPCPRVRILKAKYAVSGGASGVTALWDATADDIAWQFPAETAGEIDFREFGGLQNPKSAGWTGDINFTCAANTVYAITLWMKKKDG